ncbi:hypothetical protein ES705_14519 [subsurface metagenome]
MKKDNNKPKKGKEIKITRREDQWRIIFPVPSFEELKQEGSESWEKEKKDFIEQGEISGIKITDQDMKRKKLMWLEKWIEQKLKKTSNISPSGKKKRFTSDWDLYKIELEKFRDHIKVGIEDTEIEQPTGLKEPSEIILGIPNFDEDYKDEIYKGLKKWFSPKQHEMFKSFLENKPYSGELIFKGTSCQFGNTLYKLKNAQLISGFETNKELAEWIEQRVKYRNKGKPCNFDVKNLTNSLTDNPSMIHATYGEFSLCKNPIIDIEKNENGRYEITSHHKKQKTINQ